MSCRSGRTWSTAEVIDGFASIRLEKVGTNARAFMVIMESDGARYKLKLDELSDGQRALIALYALIHVTADQGYTLNNEKECPYSFQCYNAEEWVIITIGCIATTSLGAT